MFLAAFVPSLLSTAFIAFAQERRADRVREPLRLNWTGLPPAFRRFLLIVGLFSLGNSADAFLILRARATGASPEEAIAMFAVFNVVYVLSAYPAGALADRVGRTRVFAAGLAVFALVYGGFGLARTTTAIWVLFAVYGLYMGLTDGVSRALVAEFAPPERRGAALGLHAAIVGLALFPASALAGILWTTVSPGAPFLFGAVTALTAAALLTKSKLAPRGEPVAGAGTTD